jgi:dTDP-glucose pyrophosphorylase
LEDWTRILIKPSDTLEDAIKALHSGGARIVLVVDENTKLLGTVTDGDIRRSLIKHTSMERPIEKVMNSSPLTALLSDNQEAIIFKMKSMDLLHMPLVDDRGTLAGLETLQHLIKNKKYNNPVFLMAGGFGKRLHPLTEKIPKPLLNIGSKPILETIIRQFIDAGFHIFYISIHYKAEMIREYFGDGSNLNIKIEYIYENNPLGTAGSLGLLPEDSLELPIIIMNGDILTKVNFEHLLDFHNENNNIATMCIREFDFQVPYGVVDINGQDVVGIKEKPIHKFFVNAGIYVLESKLISRVDGGLYLDMPNFLETQIDKGDKVTAFPIHEYWLDIGRIEEYEKANREIFDINLC